VLLCLWLVALTCGLSVVGVCSKRSNPPPTTHHRPPTTDHRPPTTFFETAPAPTYFRSRLRYCKHNGVGIDGGEGMVREYVIPPHACCDRVNHNRGLAKQTQVIDDMRYLFQDVADDATATIHEKERCTVWRKHVQKILSIAPFLILATV